MYTSLHIILNQLKILDGLQEQLHQRNVAEVQVGSDHDISEDDSDHSCHLFFLPKSI